MNCLQAFRISVVVVAGFVSASFVSLQQANAQDDFAWSASSSGKRAFLSYGVPETDNVQFSAVCSGKGGGVPVASFSASLEGYSDSNPVSLAISGAGFRHVMDGVVELSQSEEGASVVVVEAPLDDPLWDALSSLPSVTYSIDGGDRIAMALRGSTRAVGRFLGSCDSFGGAASAATKPRKAPQPGAGLACASIRNAKSKKSDVPVSVTFVNQTGSYRSVMWIGFDGQPVNYANLDPGQQFTINTFVSHPWMFTDGPGNCAEVFLPQPGIAVFNITAPDPEGGD